MISISRLRNSDFKILSVVVVSLSYLGYILPIILLK